MVNTKIISYNVNGIRAAMKKGFLNWLHAARPDVICLQEIKAGPDQFDIALFEEMGYNHYWHSAVKKGYSGVAILSKTEPEHVEYGCGITAYDTEGRIIRADFSEYSIISVYMPSGSSGENRQAFKMQFLSDFDMHIDQLIKEKSRLVISGDFNICHRAIDIHNPIRNANTSGFTPEERDWMSRFLDSGFTDSFRAFNNEPNHYSWWSYRANARQKNLGWRIDYNLVSQSLSPHLASAGILKNANHADHCPVVVQLKL